MKKNIVLFVMKTKNKWRWKIFKEEESIVILIFSAKLKVYDYF